VNAQVNCFFNPDDPGVLGTLDSSSEVWWNSSTAIAWQFSGSIFTNVAGLQWHIHQYIASNLADLTTTGAHYNTQSYQEGELSSHFGNITAAKLSGSNSSTYAFPLITTGTQIIGRSVTIRDSTGNDKACCNIGFYLSGGVSTVRCQFVSNPDITGYIDFSDTFVKTNLTAISTAFLGRNASWEIRTHSVYAANCGNTLPVYNGYDLGVTLGTNLSLAYIGDRDVRTISTAVFSSASAASTATIAGRSITLHYPNSTRYATCNIGYGVGPIFDVPTPPPAPTSAPTPEATGSSSSLSAFVSLILLISLFVLFF